MMSVELESMAVDMPVVEGHPNREPFRGVLTLIDVASDKPPSGSRGHKVILTRKAAEAALPSLLGMALDYAPSLDRHDVQRKVGVITRAEIVGRTLELGGYLYARDFPELMREMIAASGGHGLNAERDGGSPLSRNGTARMRRTTLGMSYEITDGRVADLRASVWQLTRVTFTGAAILRRDKAAYRETWIELGE